jgi:hypothetical protein
MSGHRCDRAERLGNGAFGQFDLEGIVPVAFGLGQFGLSRGPKTVLVRALAGQSLLGLSRAPRLESDSAEGEPDGFDFSALQIERSRLCWPKIALISG